LQAAANGNGNGNHNQLAETTEMTETGKG